MNRLPIINYKRRICVICEGYEEKEYLEKLIELEVFNTKYDIKLINAESNSSLFGYYQDKYASGSYDIVLIFCDTDKPSDQVYYHALIEQINSHHGKRVADKIIFYVNPCSMQIILSHFSGSVSLSTQSKKRNRLLIKQLTGVSDYDAHEDQRQRIFAQLTFTNYSEMKNRIRSLPNDDNQIPSTNMLTLFGYLENDNDQWVDNINRILLDD